MEDPKSVEYGGYDDCTEFTIKVTIYIVVGECGEYDDYRDWVVKAFRSEERADEFVKEVTAEYERLRKKYSGSAIADAWYMRMHEAGDFNPLDPGMLTDDSGTEYSHFPVELEE